MAGINQKSVLSIGNGKFKKLYTDAVIEAQMIEGSNGWTVRKIIQKVEDFSNNPGLKKDEIITLCLNLKDLVPKKILNSKKSPIKRLIKALENLSKIII